MQTTGTAGGYDCGRKPGPTFVELGENREKSGDPRSVWSCGALCGPSGGAVASVYPSGAFRTCFGALCQKLNTALKNSFLLKTGVDRVVKKVQDKGRGSP